VWREVSDDYIYMVMMAGEKEEEEDEAHKKEMKDTNDWVDCTRRHVVT